MLNLFSACALSPPPLAPAFPMRLRTGREHVQGKSPSGSGGRISRVGRRVRGRGCIQPAIHSYILRCEARVGLGFILSHSSTGSSPL